VSGCSEYNDNLRLSQQRGIYYLNYNCLIAVVERCKAWVHSLAGSAGSNPAGGMDVCLLRALCVVR